MDFLLSALASGDWGVDDGVVPLIAALLWRRLAHIEKTICDAEKSRGKMHKFMRKLERRLDRAGINGGENG